jgi:hypothetical protein
MGEDSSGVMHLFAEFIRLRQAGRSRDEAWLDIEPQADSLSQKELGRLFVLLRGWEAREGRHYKPAREDPYSTMLKPPEGIEKLQREIASATPSRPPIIRRISPPPPSTPPSMGTACPSCKKLNAEGEVYCYSCGALLIQAYGATHQINPQMASNGEENTVFGPNMVLYLQVRGAKQMIRVEPRQDEMVIGRRSPENVMVPDIDLSAYQADSMGVSRMHAGLRRQDKTLVLSDMGSLNFTFINGQRLHPHEVRVLHDGDELRFGQLPVRIYFRNG